MMKTKEEAAQVQKIVSNCCNWDKGICLLLGFPCPQQLSLTRINCIFFGKSSCLISRNCLKK